MDFHLHKTSLGSKKNVMILPIHSQSLEQNAVLKQLDKDLDHLISEKNKRDVLPKSPVETCLIDGFNTLRNNTILLVGLEFSAKEPITAKTFRDAAATAIRRLNAEKINDAEWIHDPGIQTELNEHEILKAVVQGMIAGNYAFDTLKSDKKKPTLNSITISNVTQTKETKAAVEIGKISGESLNAARDLANSPANLLTPLQVIDYAQTRFKNTSVKCEVLSQKKAETLGMGAFYAIAKGSENPGAILIMTYTPQPNQKSAQPTAKSSAKSTLPHIKAGQQIEQSTEQSTKQPIVLVGKGVTFDSGGISIKPSAGMHKMKGDMGGAAAVIATMIAVSKLALNTPIIGITPLAENMPSHTAIKPGDVVTAFNKKTIEILNTDAEGRLLLADALAYAVQTFKPKHIIDIATLTGACSVALGNQAAGLLGNDPELINNLLSIGQKTGEYLWQLPLYKAHLEALKSDVADLANVSEDRLAGTSVAAKFLEQFVSKTSWAHIDIAGVMENTKTSGYKIKGMSGEGTLNLIEFCLGHAQ